MGDKLAAKEAVKKFDIPMVPGIDKAVTDVKKAEQVADHIGYPVLIKAAAGGGGKGMRIVNSEKEHRISNGKSHQRSFISFWRWLCLY